MAEPVCNCSLEPARQVEDLPFSKVHPAEISTELLETLGFRAAGAAIASTRRRRSPARGGAPQEDHAMKIVNALVVGLLTLQQAAAPAPPAPSVTAALSADSPRTTVAGNTFIAPARMACRGQRAR